MATFEAIFNEPPMLFKALPRAAFVKLFLVALDAIRLPIDSDISNTIPEVIAV